MFQFNECPKGEEPAAVVVLRLVVEKLRTCNFLQDIVSILSAKVPIVKFRHRATQLEGDISCYNILAMHNTDLLRTYTEIDERVKVSRFSVVIVMLFATFPFCDFSCYCMFIDYGELPKENHEIV